MNKTRRTLLLLASHGAVGAVGFAAGIYTLPILVAAPPPSAAELDAAAASAMFSGRFTRELKGSDRLHWGEGEVMVSATAVTHRGALAPGPDYKLYLSPEFGDDEASFAAVRPRMLRVGDVKGVGGFVLPLPAGADPAAYNTVVVWCETFGEFISAAKYR